VSDPLPVIALEYAPDPTGHLPRIRRWLRFLTHATWMTCILAWLLILWPTVETVIISGPLIAVLAIAMFLLASRARAQRHMILAAAHAGICLLFFMLVQELHWGPQAARVPFAVIGGAYAAAAALATLLWAQPLRPRRGYNAGG